MPAWAPHVTPLRDASTQVDDWLNSPGFEVEWEIARRLAVDDFPLIALEPIHLQRDYHTRDMRKRAGGTDNGGTQQWSLQPGVDLRRVLNEHIGWITEPRVARRRILFADDR